MVTRLAEAEIKNGMKGCTEVESRTCRKEDVVWIEGIMCEPVHYDLARSLTELRTVYRGYLKHQRFEPITIGYIN